MGGGGLVPPQRRQSGVFHLLETLAQPKVCRGEAGEGSQSTVHSQDSSDENRTKALPQLPADDDCCFQVDMSADSLFRLEIPPAIGVQ